jgi:Rrf2 family protein
MFITRESDYAVRIVRELAGGGKKTVQEICRREEVPPQFGYKILKKLENRGLVKGFRGTNGGYSLAKNADEITLFDVICAVDGNLLVSECMNYGYQCPMNNQGRRCGVHAEFARIQDLLIRSLQEKSLGEIFRSPAAVCSETTAGGVTGGGAPR